MAVVGIARFDEELKDSSESEFVMSLAS